MIFKTKPRDRADYDIYLYGMPLERVYEYKYLGIILTESLNNDCDSSRITNGFLKQFNSMYYKFNFADRNVLNFLFRSYCSSFYGLELHYDSKRKKNLKPMAIAYHKAIKKLCNLNKWESNHYACELLDVDVFIHLQAKRMFKFCTSVMSARNRIFRLLRYYINYQSMIKTRVKKIFKDDYDINDVFSNDNDAVLARIDFIQKNEPRTYSALSVETVN